MHTITRMVRLFPVHPPPNVYGGINIQISKMSNQLYAPFLDGKEGKSVKTARAVRAISKLGIFLAYYFLKFLFG